ncbi:MAG: type IX secretion system sortase PorU [Flavobacterium sp.]|nr:MAG: type IX secretion system sortase PorU [Flavobacterium sp.]
MKNRLLFFVLFTSFLSFAQQNAEIVLSWTDNVKTSVGEVAVTIPQFQGEYMNFIPDKKVLLLSATIPVSSAVAENSLQVTNIVYESITRQQLGELSATAVPSAINASVRSFLARNDWYAVISLSPIIKEGNTFKRIKSFTYSYTISNSAMLGRSSNATNAISNSVLNSGEWHRFYVEKSGVYKISRSFLQQLGVNVNSDPRNMKIFGNGGRMVPLLNSTEYPMDLAENAITIIGEEDGTFNNSDYILFYAEGVDNWSQENGTHNNLYSNRSYYYITSQGGAGKRIGTMMQPSAPSTQTVASVDSYQYYEKDLISIARLGRKWHGEQFNVNNEQEFAFTLPDIDASSPVKVSVSAAANSTASTSMTIEGNGGALGTINFFPSGQYDAAFDGFYTGNLTASGENVEIGLTYNNNGNPSANAWLDYIILQSKRRLRGNGKQFRFQYNDAASNIGVAEFQVSNAAGISEIWDITNIYDVAKISNTGNQGSFSFKVAMGEVRKYITVSSSDYYTPLKESKARVANQNLKGTIFNNSQGQFQDIDYIIITPEFLAASAEKLANIHRNQSQLNVKVVKLENIYQEFSSGKQDIGAIRNFVKYVYFNASATGKRIKYLNLFGDASFDFKDRIPNNTNIVPIFHGYSPGGNLPNYSTTLTFVSDDFFGLMDPQEGTLNSADGVDIAVGRMLVSSVQQADEMVNKVVEYLSVDAYGRWRNEYTIITDDLDGNGSTEFVPEMERLAATLTETQNRPFINIRKIHSDAYVQQASAGGQRYPEAKEDIIRSINYGTLVVNYLGHGGEDGMAGERLFEKSDAQNLNNKFKYPLFITATCELTKFDNPYRPTAGEFIYWNKGGGAIAMITTTRSIFISDAFSFNKSLSEKLYAFGSNEYPTMAEALRLTKINGNSYRVIAFVGDPALKLAVPKPRVVLTEINGVPLAQSTDVLKSLSYVKLGGRVEDEGGNVLNSYSGEVAVTVFDKPIQRVTLNNDNMTRQVTIGGVTTNVPAITNFNTLGETIFRGNATVNNGVFEFGFVVPRDIRVPVAEGRVSFYSKRYNVLQDQTGYDATIKVGGVNENAVADNTAPRVRLYMNEEAFISGGITNESPIFLAFLEDENGINTSSGIGHDIIAILDGDETNPYLLNDFYEANIDDHTRGKLSFPFSNLAKGMHTITFKAWDVYNNLVTAEIQFVVVGGDKMHIEKVLNYPNPFVSYTEFWFTHNRPFEPLDVQVQILTITGKVVKTINQSVMTDGFLCRDIRWDGRDDFGDRIGKGVYVYKLTVRSSTTNKSAEKYEKLVLL